MDVGYRVTAALWFAYDREADTLYAYSEYYGKLKPGQAYSTAVHAAAVRSRGDWINGVIDPASRTSSQTDGMNLLNTYRSEHKLKLSLANNVVEAGVQDVQDRIATGRLKLFRTLVNLNRELRTYRRKDNGRIVKQNDHLMDCLRYGVRSGIPRARTKVEAHAQANTANLNAWRPANKSTGY